MRPEENDFLDMQKDYELEAIKDEYSLVVIGELMDKNDHPFMVVRYMHLDNRTAWKAYHRLEG